MSEHKVHIVAVSFINCGGGSLFHIAVDWQATLDRELSSKEGEAVRLVELGSTFCPAPTMLPHGSQTVVCTVDSGFGGKYIALLLFSTDKQSAIKLYTDKLVS